MHFQPIETSPDDAYLAQGGGGLRVEHESSPLDQFDDVFGSAPASPTEQEAQNGPHPSDMRRLETEHTTAGYREGITMAKESSIQAGFDEGFSLGATIGSRAGQLLGVTEGIADALKGQTGEAIQASVKLLDEAREELSTANIFSAEYWASDGNWNYDVIAKEGDQILFTDVANAHPLIRKWSNIVDEQVRLWHIQLSLLDDESGPRVDTAVVEPLNAPATAGTKQTLDW
ncbi:Essential protein Yae1, N terminal [Conoideocrella luteorostrata]|uniref:Protein YAE1 n=1 Tax=Conoideocrella luteorostrata TaxID=1105319 RepID=A0AAJ0CQS0_9HYPO|nr:Essential protein Yae1, N terminal [Conoideocrella luteorostrata]